MIKKKDYRYYWKKIWYFIWEDDSIWSWIINIILAYVIIKFLVYPGLGFMLNTTHPIVAVVSGSMEHESTFDEWWESQESWYTQHNITKEEFVRFPFKNGFNKGDIMILMGKKPQDIKKGDITVFKSARRDPIIHRVVGIFDENNDKYFQTKGDHNQESIKSNTLDETKIHSDHIIGIAKIKIPYLGYIKIWFVELLKLSGLVG